MTDERSILSGLRDLVEFYQGDTNSVETVKVTTNAVDLRAIRRKLQITQEKLAEVYEIPLGTIRNWEQGRRQIEGGTRSLPLLIELIDIINSDPEISLKIRQKIQERKNMNKIDND